MSKIGDKHNLQLMRKLWHMLGGLLIAYILYLFMDSYRGLIASALFVVLCFTCLVEYIRLTDREVNRFIIRCFSLIMRKREIRQVSGIVYYIISCLIVDMFFPKNVAVLSILFLAIGDPLASLAGTLISSKDTIKIFPGKSLPGMVASFLACFLITLVFLTSRDSFSSGIALVSLFGGLIGTFAEALPFPIDDNFSIPIVSAVLLSVIFNLSRIS